MRREKIELTAVYQNNDERLGDCVKFTIAEMTACYRDNHWDVRADGQTMTDSEIEDDILDHEVEFVGDWTADAAPGFVGPHDPCEIHGFDACTVDGKLLLTPIR